MQSISFVSGHKTKYLNSLKSKCFLLACKVLYYTTAFSLIPCTPLVMFLNALIYSGVRIASAAQDCPYHGDSDATLPACGAVLPTGSLSSYLWTVLSPRETSVTLRASIRAAFTECMLCNYLVYFLFVYSYTCFCDVCLLLPGPYLPWYLQYSALCLVHIRC